MADFEQPARLDRKDSAIIAKLIFLPNVSRTQDEFRWCCACDFSYWITSHVCLRQITEKKKHFVRTRQKWIVWALRLSSADVYEWSVNLLLYDLQRAQSICQLPRRAWCRLLLQPLMVASTLWVLKDWFWCLFVSSHWSYDDWKIKLFVFLCVIFFPVCFFSVEEQLKFCWLKCKVIFSVICHCPVALVYSYCICHLCLIVLWHQCTVIVSVISVSLFCDVSVQL